MPRLPIDGGDQGQWGPILNDFLDVSFDDSGSIVASTARITGASSVEDMNVSSDMVVEQMRSTGAGSFHVMNAASEAAINQLFGFSRWTGTESMTHASTTAVVSAAAVHTNGEVQLTIRSPDDPRSVPVLMVDSIVNDTSFMIVANQAIQSATPVMYTIVRR